MEFPQFSAFLITLREALEALLIVGIICTYLIRINAKQYLKWVAFGSLLAIFASLVVAYLFQVVLSGFGGMLSQTYLRAGIMFASAVLLTHMVIWVAKQARGTQNRAEAKVEKIVSSGSFWNMTVHSFLVVLREGVETVFFFAAISAGDIGKALTSWGALAGIIAACAISYVFFKGTRKIPLSVFFKVTGIFIIFIAAGLISNSIGMMQDMGKLGSVYMTKGGQIGEVYNLVSILPEHPQDELHYIRDHGKDTLISGNVGVFLNSMFGYTQNPSVEQFAAYWIYYIVTFFLMLWISKVEAREREKKKSAEHGVLHVKKSLAG
ncbi:MAG TPA: FTR1 family protein [Bacilli bacterium]